jgi:hypothetical protein
VHLLVTIRSLWVKKKKEKKKKKDKKKDNRQSEINSDKTALDYLETRRDRREKTRGINRNACLFLLSFLAFPLSERQNPPFNKVQFFLPHPSLPLLS